MKTYQRYWLFQLPGIAVVVAVLSIGAAWFALPLWLCALTAGLWVLKDLLLYPFVKPAYQVGVPSGADRLIGAGGVATRERNPEGYVKIEAELWQARSAAAVSTDEAVRVIAAEGMVLIVERVRIEGDRRRS